LIWMWMWVGACVCARRYGGEAYAHALAPSTLTHVKALREQDAAGNTVKTLLLSGTQHVRTKVAGMAGAVVERKEGAGAVAVGAAQTRDERVVARLVEEAEADMKLTRLQQVEKYRAAIEDKGALLLRGAARQTALISRAARMSKGRRSSVQGSKVGARAQALLEQGKAVPRNVFIKGTEYREMLGKHKREYAAAKAAAREQGDEVTPRLVKAREALRYMGGTRNDVIATGARFGKRAEFMEIRKREDRARGRRRGPHGLMHRPSGS
jgi:hypothetical protein